MSQAIIDSITPIFREVFEDDSLVVTPNLTANDVKNWDSLNHITLIVELEELVGFSFTTDELANLRNVGDFINLLSIKGYCG